MKKLQVEWIKSRNYEELTSGNSISKSRWCNTLINAVPLSRQILMLPDVCYKYLMRTEVFNSLHTP